MEALAVSNPKIHEISVVIAKASKHWEGSVPFADLAEEVKVATSRVAQLFLVNSVASFEEFLNGYQSEAENAGFCRAVSEPTTDQEAKEQGGWSRALARYESLWERVAPEGSASDISDHYGSLLVADVFVRLRNRIAHTSGSSAAASLSARLKSKELSKAWKAIADGTASQQLPALPSLPTNGGLPVIGLPHAILASVVFHRLAGTICTHALRVDTDRRALALAVNEALSEVALPKDSDARVRRLNAALNRASCARWTDATIRPALREHDLWDRLRGRTTG